jgi:hypothetical protein
MRVRIEEIEVRGVGTLTLNTSGVTCIVGGNNVGKSQLLQDILSYLEAPERLPVLLDSLTLVRETPTREVWDAWLESCTSRDDSNPPRYTPVSGSGGLTADQIRSSYDSQPDRLLNARTFFVWYADAPTRVNLGAGVLTGRPGMAPNPSPIAALWRDGELEQTLSDLAHRNFGFDLTLDRTNTEILLRVGIPSVPPPPINRPTREYADSVSALPRLDQQGDGVKSFVGLVLNLLAGKQQVILIDEPEAFLHPAQSRSLGRWLAVQAVERDRQLILATHDRGILLGLLEGAAPVTVLRLARSGNETRVAQLAEAELNGVWADPVLRFSNVLDGLFQTAVVICEADADCRFYSAVLSGLDESGTTVPNPDEVLFVPSGGKSRVHTLASALRALDVDTWAIVDFDVLKERAIISRIVTSIGSDWSLFESDYSAFVGVVGNPAMPVWASLKSSGVSAVPPGPATIAATSLLRMLAEARILVVPVGELEGFDRSTTLEGSQWVSNALENDVHRTSQPAKDLLGLLAG